MKIKKNIIGIAMLTAIMSTSFISTSSDIYADTDNEVVKTNQQKSIVEISDNNLKRAINKALGRGESLLDITIWQMQSLTKLEVWATSDYSKEIKSIDGLEHATNLVYLKIHGQKIEDITPISSLNKLEYLDLSSNYIKDIAPLKDLSKLTYLDLGGNQITEFDSLKNLINITELYLYSEETRSIDAVKNMKKLKNLVVYAPKVKDISCISELKLLESLYLNEVSISDSNLLSNLTNLETLSLASNNMNNLDGIKNLTKLTDLTVNDNNIEDISQLSTLTNLRYLSLAANNIEIIKPLETLDNVDTLVLIGNKVKDISPLVDMEKLSSVELIGNEIVDLRPLKDANQITSVSLGEQSIALPKVKVIDGSVTIDIPKVYNKNGKILTPVFGYDRPYNPTVKDGKISWSKIDKNTELYINFQDIITIGNNDNIEYTVEYRLPVSLEINFSDIKGHWAISSILDFVDKEYINGYKDGTFRPDSTITRAEFVKILNRVFNLTEKSGVLFEDTLKHWAKDEIDIAVTNNVCNGESPSKFNPDAPITREQAAVMISNYKRIADKNHDKINKYKDNTQVSSWAKDAVEGVIEKGYMNGYKDDTFRPKANITRAEAVVTLQRTLNN